MTTEHIATPARVDVSTLSNYIKAQTAPLFTKDLFFGALKAHGRISHNHGGKDINWPVKFRRRKITEAAGYNESIAFPQTNVHKRASIPWRRFRLGESVSKFEKLANRGQARQFDALGNLVDDCMEDFLADFRPRVFDDGAATGSKTLMGFESMFGNSGAIALGLVAEPTDTYANLSCARGNYGGDWTPDTGSAWPSGEGDREYGFWTPMIVDYTNASSTPGWTATTKTWVSTWQEALRFSMTMQEIIQQEKFNFCLMAPNLLLEAKQSLEDNQRFELTQNSKITTETGFHTLAFEGIELQSQYGVPAACAYLFSWDAIELMTMEADLITVQQDTDITDSTDLYHLDSFCNIKFKSPAYFAKLAAIT